MHTDSSRCLYCSVFERDAFKFHRNFSVVTQKTLHDESNTKYFQNNYLFKFKHTCNLNTSQHDLEKLKGKKVHLIKNTYIFMRRNPT